MQNSTMDILRVKICMVLFFEILCPKEAKIIQKHYATYWGKPFTEGIYPDNAKFKILKSEINDNIVRLRMEYIAD